jgi:hypothetical protein
MRLTQTVTIIGTVAGFLAIALTGSSPRVRADNGQGNEQQLIQIGFQIAPVTLNLAGKDQDLVGLGSFIVNAIGDCNGCHTSAGPPNFNYASSHNPYFGQPYFNQKPPFRTDPKAYLSGGADFGPAVPPSPVPPSPPGFPFYPWVTPPIPSSYPPAAYIYASGPYVGPDMITRNLTPDKTGLPEGGHTLAQFEDILTNGTDYDHLHPTCTTGTPTPQPANCIPPPVDGSLLQIMPWPVFHNMTEHQMEAVYEYLKAIPCIEGPKTPADIAAVNPNAVYAFAQLHNNCN